MSKKIRQIAIYGKGGIGKSTTTSNLSAALSEMGYRVMQFGCDPKADSTNTLRGGSYIPTVLDLLRENSTVDAHEAIFKGFNGIWCVEAGGPAPGVGCAGRGITTAVTLLKQQRVFEELDLDYVIYDVLGDVVCGGFAVPIREGIAEHVFTVTSSDFMAVYAANNLFKGIQKYSNSGGALLGGVIANSINHPSPKGNRGRLRAPHQHPGDAVRAPLHHRHPVRAEGPHHHRSRAGKRAGGSLPGTGAQGGRPYGFGRALPPLHPGTPRMGGPLGGRAGRHGIGRGAGPPPPESRTIKGGFAMSKVNLAAPEVQIREIRLGSITGFEGTAGGTCRLRPGRDAQGQRPLLQPVHGLQFRQRLLPALDDHRRRRGQPRAGGLRGRLLRVQLRLPGRPDGARPAGP